jgi:predicted membrane metal-binding protein
MQPLDQAMPCSTAARELLVELAQAGCQIAEELYQSGRKVFLFNFRLVNLPEFDPDEYPLQKRGVTEFPWLYFIGLSFLHASKSGLLHGVGDDAAYVVEHIALPIVS